MICPANLVKLSTSYWKAADQSEREQSPKRSSRLKLPRSGSDRPRELVRFEPRFGSVSQFAVVISVPAHSLRGRRDSSVGRK